MASTAPPPAAPPALRSPPSLTGSFGARARYFAVTALRSLAQAPMVTTLTVATIGVTLFVLGLFVLGTLNLASAVSGWGHGLVVVVELRQGAPAESGAAVIEAARASPWTRGARVVPRDEALARLRHDLGGRAADLLAGLAPEDNPLGDQVELELGPARGGAPAALGGEAFARAAPDALPTPDDLERLAESLRTHADVVAVEYGADLVAGLQALLKALRAAAVALALVLMIATVFVVANTLKLTVLARADEIEIMKLVGATDTFVRVPFVLEGLVQGGLGGLLAVGGLATAYHFAAPAVERALGPITGPFEATFLPPAAWLTLAGAGFVLGFLGSLLAVGRHLR